ncbi:MAG: hypothetical protein Kow00117_04200 [Phototrophicales bacterium]
MTEVIEIRGTEEATSRQYRLGHFLTLSVAILAFLYGLNIRANITTATTPYTDVRAGIRVRYPRNWLIDIDGDYVFRVRDMTQIGFKTTIQVSLRPMSADMTEQNVLNTLHIARAESLFAYDPQSTAPYLLPDNLPATAMTYTYIERDPNPFLESASYNVTGLDILINTGSQVLIVTFRTDSNRFNDDLPIFEQFLASLEF